MRLCLHALDDDAHLEIVRHLDDAPQDGGRALRIFEILHKSHVDLQNIDRHVLEHVERTVAAAEIVHEDREADVVQPFQDA